MKISWFLLYSGLLLSVSAFSIDILLPSMLSIGSALGVTIEKVQLIIPVYMLALGLANPVYGALSDRVGRRPGIYLGLGIYVVGSCVCVVAPTITFLLIGRFLQGFGAASAPVICRAMIRDKYSGVALAQNMAVASMFFALGPMLAPLLGYLIYESLGWRAVFGFLVLIAIAMIVATNRQEETLPLSARKSRGLNSMRADTVAVFSNLQSRYFIVLSCFCTCLILTFLSHAMIVYTSFGVSAGKFALLFAVSSIGIVFGQYINHRLIRLIGAMTAAAFAGVVIAVTAFIIWLCSIIGLLNEYVFSLLMFAFNSSYLIVFSNFVSLTLEPHGLRAGTASAMFGFTSYIVGALMAGTISFITAGHVSKWAFCFLLLSIIVSVGTLRFKFRNVAEV